MIFLNGLGLLMLGVALLIASLSWTYNHAVALVWMAMVTVGGLMMTVSTVVFIARHLP